MERRHNRNKRGIALVIVLGMLTLMVLLGVAFSIYMRTERLAAGNFRNDVRVRHLMQAALAHALGEVDGYLTTPPVLAYPDWPQDVFVSQGSTNYPVSGLVSKEMEDFIPQSFLGIATSTPVYWQDLGADGSYAYIVLNCSGLLDANYAGGINIPRSVGTNINEIQLFALPEIQTSNNANLFANQRWNYDNRYETLQDLGEVNQGLTNWPAHFVTYSRYPTSGVSKVYIGPNTSLWNVAAIKQAFRNAGLDPSLPGPGAECDAAYRSLLDYVDDDIIPQALNVKGGVEPVPMINEFMTEARITTLPSGNYYAKPSVFIEWFYPFAVSETNHLFQMQYTIVFTPTNGNTDVNAVPLSVYDKKLDVNTTPINAHIYGSININTGVEPGMIPIGSTGLPARVHYGVEIKAKVIVSGTTNVVDATPWPETGSGIKFDIDFNPPALGAIRNDFLECFDPRFNWRTDGQQWRKNTAGANTIGSENTLTTEYFNGPNNNIDRDTFMHVANAPLRTVGDLGYLCYELWKTIRLYDAFPRPPNDLNHHRVLDYFTLTDPATPSGIGRGLVNINTKNKNVLKAALVSMPRKEYLPGNPFALTGSALDTVAQFIIDNCTANGPYTNVSDLGRLNWENSGIVEGQLEKNLISESLLRNATGLFGTRQNLFIILLAAQVTKTVKLPNDTEIKSILSGQRGVAEVWRDPVAVSMSGTTNYPCLLRFFKIITD